MNPSRRTSLRTDKTERPLLEDIFMSVAKIIATRSTCPNEARHGAVLVRSGHIISMGYGSPASGIPPCTKCWLREQPQGKRKDWSVCPAIHAEANAISMAAKFGISVAGSTVYVTKIPCENCLRLLHHSGVDEYVTSNEKGELYTERVYQPHLLISPKEMDAM